MIVRPILIRGYGRVSAKTTVAVTLLGALACVSAPAAGALSALPLSDRAGRHARLRSHRMCLPTALGVESCASAGSGLGLPYALHHELEAAGLSSRSSRRIPPG
jgi:hypothetical protein